MEERSLPGRQAPSPDPSIRLPTDHRPTPQGALPPPTPVRRLRPERYRERIDFKGTLANLDLRRLPDELIERLARGENPISVLAPILSDPNVKLLGAGEDGEQAETT